MELYSVDKDNVIKAFYLTGRVSYQYALDNLIGLIDKLDMQRRFQNENFYKRLEVDFQHGCITPSITLAFIRPVDLNSNPTVEELKKEITKDISKGFILDGIQRLNTLKRVAGRAGNTLDQTKNLYINIIICPLRDNLLYRMVTLNNGQKPMTARHQIEILAETIYDFNTYAFKVYTEKENIAKNEKSFKKADIINAYISFISNSTSLDNKKIIEDKLDELVARKIIESNITESSLDFDMILRLIEKLSESEFLLEWLKNGNNLIGFSVGIKKSYGYVGAYDNNEIEVYLETFEKAFKNINVSKIKLSRERRRLSEYYISNINELFDKDADELTLELADQL